MMTKTQIVFSHNDILFILNRQSLIIVDISDLSKNSINLIALINNSLTLTSSFKIMISKSTLLIVSDRIQKIEEYSITNFQRIYQRKNYPLYNFNISGMTIILS